MPIPVFVAWGVAAGLGALGIKKGIDAYSDSNKAQNLGYFAEEKLKEAQTSLEISREQTQRALEELGKLKIYVFTHQIKYLVDMHKKFRSKIEGFNENILIDSSMQECSSYVQKSLDLESCLAKGAITGALASFGAFGSVGALATASTGTAIGSLSGAAATNATLAWLGGGSLAAGGFGMAGGMVALGGIALAPILAVGGFLMASKAEETLTKAKKYVAEVDVAIENIEKFKTILKGIRTAVAEHAQIIADTAKLFDKVKVDNIDDKPAFNKMLIIGKNLSKILNISVLNEDGTGNQKIKVQCEGCLKINY